MPEWALSQNIFRVIMENFKYQFNSLEGFLIDNPKHNIRHKRKKEDHRASVKWRAPSRGWIKRNFDGAAKGNPRKARCGGIIRDRARNTIDAIAIPIGILNSHRAEATATLYTMKVVAKIGY